MTDSPIRGFSHVQLRVSDVARSVDWWSSVLGLAPLGEPRGGATPLVGAGGRYVVVISEGYSGAGDVDHLAFSVGSRDDLGTWADELTARGVAHGGLVESGEGLSIHLVDPDGLNVELIAP